MSEAAEPAHWAGDGCATHRPFEEILLCETAITTEIAEKLGITTYAVQRYVERRKKNRFPEPIWVRGSFVLYDFAEVEAWYRLYQFYAGRST